MKKESEKKMKKHNWDFKTMLLCEITKEKGVGIFIQRLNLE